MGRIHRVVAPGCPHHITQRGNFRRQVFFDDEDRHTYLDLLAAAASQAELAVLGFCLMTNHVHWIAVPAHAGSMALALREAHRNYSGFGDGALNLEFFMGFCPRREPHFASREYFFNTPSPVAAIV